MEEYGGRAVDSSQDARSGRKIWTEHVDVICATAAAPSFIGQHFDFLPSVYLHHDILHLLFVTYVLRLIEKVD